MTGTEAGVSPPPTGRRRSAVPVVLAVLVTLAVLVVVAVVVRGRLSPAPTPVAVVDAYQQVSPLMDREPEHWGGAWADGDRLAVRHVGRTGEQARAALAAVGAGPAVRLVPGTVSLRDLRRAQDAADSMLRGDPDAVGWGPEQRTGRLVVDVVRARPELVARLRAAVGPGVEVDVRPGARRASGAG